MDSQILLTGRKRAEGGFSLVEIGVVLAIAAVLMGIGVASFRNWAANQQAKDGAKQLSDVLFVARSEAIRTGVNHIVFFNTDTAGAALLAANGVTPVAALLIADVDGDFAPSAGEHRATVPLIAGANIAWGRTNAPLLVPRNGGATIGDPFSGTAVENSAQEVASAGNFRHPTQAATVQSWVIFAPDGTPRAFHPAAATPIASVGTGDGAIYLNNGDRDYAVVMSALGAVKTFGWDAAANAWR